MNAGHDRIWSENMKIGGMLTFHPFLGVTYHTGCISQCTEFSHLSLFMWGISSKCITSITGPQGTSESLPGPAAHHESSSLYTIKQAEPALITAAYGAHLWNDEVPWTAGHWLQLLLGNHRTDPPQIAYRVYWSTDKKKLRFLCIVLLLPRKQRRQLGIVAYWKWLTW